MTDRLLSESGEALLTESGEALLTESPPAPVPRVIVYSLPNGNLLVVSQTA